MLRFPASVNFRVRGLVGWRTAKSGEVAGKTGGPVLRATLWTASPRRFDKLTAFGPIRAAQPSARGGQDVYGMDVGTNRADAVGCRTCKQALVQ